ncbi:MAG: Holliday junction resolvase-like protein [Candidatus Thorarchaeota archaeon]
MLIELTIGILLLIIAGLILYNIYQKRMINIRVQEQVQKEKDQIRKDALTRSRAVLKGKIGEQMAPLLDAFPFQPADARFIGSPVDYIVFDGYSQKNPREIVLIDIKTGNAQLSSTERRIAQLVNTKRIRWMTIRI